MAAPTRGLLGNSSAGLNSGNISWPAIVSSSTSVTGTTPSATSSNNFTCNRDSTSLSESERRVLGVSSAIQSSNGQFILARGKKTSVCRGKSILDSPLGVLGGYTLVAAQANTHNSGGLSVLRLGSQFEGGCAHASHPFCVSGPVDSVSNLGALQCRSMNGGLLVLPSLTRRLRSLTKGLPSGLKFVERNGVGVSVPVMALGRRGQDVGDEGKDINEARNMQALEGNWHTDLSQPSQSSDAEASWEQISMVFRVVYALAMYGVLAFAGNVICNFTGVDLSGGFELSSEVITTAFGYAVPPMMALLFILEDEVVKTWGPARAIRDVEDEELMDFYVGMSPCLFPFVVAAGAVAEELFFRVAIQGGLAHALQISDKGVTDTTIGLAALTGVIPLFIPFAQIFAAALTAGLTSSMYYVISSPKDPKYVVAPVVRGCSNRGDIKERVEAWYARRQEKKIYSPLIEGLLAMYLGFEWIHTGNILAPIITHTLYSLVIVGNGLRRIHDNREKLRQRVNKITGQRLVSIGVGETISEKVK